MLKVWYQHVPAASALPALRRGTSFGAVVLAERELNHEDLRALAAELTDSGAKTFLIFGSASHSWNGLFGTEATNEALGSVNAITRWHADETLDSVFGYAHRTALAEEQNSSVCGIIDLAPEPRERLIINQFHLSQWWG